MILAIMCILIALMALGDDSSGGLVLALVFMVIAVVALMRNETNDLRADLRKAGFELVDSDSGGLSARNKIGVTVKANHKLYVCSAEDIDGTWKIIDKKTCVAKWFKPEPESISPEDLENP